MSFLKGIWKTNPSKHQKLSEELALQNPKDENPTETIGEDDVVTFKLKYLGCEHLKDFPGENTTQEAVKNILKTLKTQKKKPQRVDFSISLKGIVVTDSKGTEILKISIYKISNCCTDPSNPQIFSFTSTNTDETMECHVFGCGKRKFSENVALSVAHAFTTAYEEWRILPSTREFQTDMESKKNHNNTKIPIANKEKEIKNDDQIGRFEEQLIRFEDEDIIEMKSKHQREWVCFDDESALKPQKIM